MKKPFLTWYTVLFTFSLYTGSHSYNKPVSSEALDTLHTISIVSHGWHTGIILTTADLPISTRRMPGFPAKRYTEFGWGDRDFYSNPDFDFWITSKAALWPTESVMHVVGFDRETDDYFASSDVISLQIGRQQMSALIDFIISGFASDSTGSFIVQGKGLYGDSRFYKGEEAYIFPKTCNVWTAACLRAAGFDIRPMLYQRAGSLMERMKEEKRKKKKEKN